MTQSILQYNYSINLIDIGWQIFTELKNKRQNFVLQFHIDGELLGDVCSRSGYYLSDKGYIHKGTHDYILEKDTEIVEENYIRHSYSKLTYENYITSLRYRIPKDLSRIGVEIDESDITVESNNLSIEFSIPHNADEYKNLLIKIIEDRLQWLGVVNQSDRYIEYWNLISDERRLKSTPNVVMKQDKFNVPRYTPPLDLSSLEKDAESIYHIYMPTNILELFLWKMRFVGLLDSFTFYGEGTLECRIDPNISMEINRDHIPMSFNESTGVLIYGSDTYKFPMGGPDYKLLKVLFRNRDKVMTCDEILSEMDMGNISQPSNKYLKNVKDKIKNITGDDFIQHIVSQSKTMQLKSIL